ncbi:50S ribosomal protein L25 [Candidatus Saccharibacteria bacterium]|nr:50S ribosomal protein L25 [Candidatus Saccharibacteria bacterium]MCB9834635.1 50S ribosomal protein L25 [Candidatus Nomurabacteria bacterium]
MKVRLDRRQILDLKELRQQGYVPTVIYGGSDYNQLLQVNQKEAKQWVEAGSSHIFEAELDDKDLRFLVHQYQLNPVNGDLLSMDLYLVKAGHKITAMVPIVLTGDSSAIRNHGGELNQEVYQLEVHSLPKDLPESIELDLGVLENIGDSILVRDLKLPAGVEVLLDDTQMIVKVSQPREEEQDVDSQAEQISEGSESASTEDQA